MKKRKWFLYTVIVGLLPFIIRLFIYLVAMGLPWSYILNEVDLVAFGLVLNISIINELEDKANADRKWKTTSIGISVVMLVLFSVLLAIGYLSNVTENNNINKFSLKYLALFLSTVTFLMSYSIYDRINLLEDQK